ncbi:unnamed protein product, partial [Scytosiphon promiscuus]
AEVARSAAPGRYLGLTGVWRAGDRVELRLKMAVAAESLPAASDIIAFTYGPLVLAGALGGEGLVPGADIIVNERKYGDYNNTPFTVPRLVGDRAALARSIQATGKPLEFTIPSAQGTSIRLIPYHRIAHERYATYWDIGRDEAAD